MDSSEQGNGGQSGDAGWSPRFRAAFGVSQVASGAVTPCF